MFDAAAGYREIFDRRGADYDRAMQAFPAARAAEFRALVRLADVQAGDAVCDAPAGGGYMLDYLPAGTRATLVETSAVFHALSARRPHAERLLAETVSALPVAPARFDACLSLAGLHHNADQPGFFREARRILAPGGRLCIGDVQAGSAVARLLDGFVGAHLPEGHAGTYLTEATAATIAACGFEIVSVERRPVPWRFVDRAAMADFCRLLFGLPQLTAGQMLDGLYDHLAVMDDAAGVSLSWDLLYIRADAV